MFLIKIQQQEDWKPFTLLWLLLDSLNSSFLTWYYYSVFLHRPWAFGVYLVVILHDIVDPTLSWKKKKSRSISATTAVEPWESNKYLCLSTKYEVRQDTLKGNSHYLPFQLVLTRIKHIKDVLKFSFRAGQITLTWISPPSGFPFAL